LEVRVVDEMGPYFEPAEVVGHRRSLLLPLRLFAVANLKYSSNGYPCDPGDCLTSLSPSPHLSMPQHVAHVTAQTCAFGEFRDGFDADRLEQTGGCHNNTLL